MPRRQIHQNMKLVLCLLLMVIKKASKTPNLGKLRRDPKLLNLHLLEDRNAAVKDHHHILQFYDGSQCRSVPFVLFPQQIGEKIFS